MLRFERNLWNQGCERVAGVDEAGRGPLAGPVVAGAVVIEPAFADAQEHGMLRGITDSKQISAATRESLYSMLRGLAAVQIGVGMADVREIDALNILRATHLAMARAVRDLPLAAGHILVDGLAVGGLPCSSTAIVGGDARSLSIAAASIVAKVVRDRLMNELNRRYPEYGFAQHKGYGTAAHIQALLEFGPCPEHRMTFRPVRDAADLRRRTAASAGRETGAEMEKPEP